MFRKIILTMSFLLFSGIIFSQSSSNLDEDFLKSLPEDLQDELSSENADEQQVDKLLNSKTSSLKNKEALKMANKLISLNNSFEKYVSKTGVIYRKQEAYGLTQIIDEEAVKRLGREEAIEILSGSFKIQAKNSPTNPRNITDEKARKIAENYLNKSDAVRKSKLVF